jgi:hypothetical protein
MILPVVAVKSERYGWAGHVNQSRWRMKVYRKSMKSPVSKPQLGWPRGRWEGNTKVDFKGSGF